MSWNMLDVSKAARRTGLTWRTTKTLFESGQLPVVVIGNRQYVNADALDALLSTGSAQQTEEVACDA